MEITIFCGENGCNKYMVTRYGGNTAYPEVKRIKLSIFLVKLTVGPVLNLSKSFQMNINDGSRDQ